jgi:hypothetical protein
VLPDANAHLGSGISEARQNCPGDAKVPHTVRGAEVIVPIPRQSAAEQRPRILLSSRPATTQGFECGRLPATGDDAVGRGHAQEAEQIPQCVVWLCNEILIPHQQGSVRLRFTPGEALGDHGGPVGGVGLYFRFPRGEVTSPLHGVDALIVKPRRYSAIPPIANDVDESCGREQRGEHREGLMIVRRSLPDRVRGAAFAGAISISAMAEATR